MECINVFNQQDLQCPHGGSGTKVSSSSSSPPPPRPPQQHLVSPRISFSNDFSLDASGRPSVRYERRPPAAAAASSPPSDFEFSVGNHSMMAADELFSRGRLRPLREQQHCAAAPPPTQIRSTATTTLRDELLAGDGAEDALTFSPSPSSSSSSSGLMAKVPLKWKTLMGLRKGNSEDKKQQHDKETR